MISCDADQEPMLQVNIEGKPITLMLDTGASFVFKSKICLAPPHVWKIYKDSRILGGNSATSYDGPCEHKSERH